MNHGDFRQVGLTLTAIGLFLGTLCVCLSGCKGKDSPTEPSSGPVYELHFLDGRIENVNGVASLTGCQALLDGRVFDMIGSTRSLPTVSYSLGFSTHATTGTHTLEIRITDQQGSPQPYRVSNMTLELWDLGYPNSKKIGRATLPDATQTLATGQGFVFMFSI